MAGSGQAAGNSATGNSATGNGAPPTAEARRGAAGANAQLPPWRRAELPAWAQSVRILRGDQPLLDAARSDGKRRGSASREALLPLFGSKAGPGCGAPWLLVGPQAWVCGDAVEMSGTAPFAARTRPPTPRADGLPHEYYFVSRDGSFGYSRMDQVDIGEPDMGLEPGFGVAIVEEREVEGQVLGRTNRGLWVPMRDMNRARIFTFQGSSIDKTRDGEIPFGWVVKRKASLHSRHGQGFVANGRSRRRFDRVANLERVDGFTGGFVRIDDQNNWARARDLRLPTIAAPPEEAAVAQGERWIDIELDSQTLVAYEGDKPVFATLVSTGKSRRKGHPFETPKGVHRIWVKLLTTTMDNLENEWAQSYYRIEDVPYVQFFSKGVGLHAAFWHRGFGQVRSHGCVNLAPLDAKRLFWWTGPRIPSGWTAALPSQFDRGTLIRVR
ncbi:MAG: L,D-transpeptidase [Planctomycetota bacterium]